MAPAGRPGASHWPREVAELYCGWRNFSPIVNSVWTFLDFSQRFFEFFPRYFTFCLQIFELCFLQFWIPHGSHLNPAQKHFEFRMEVFWSLPEDISNFHPLHVYALTHLNFAWRDFSTSARMRSESHTEALWVPCRHFLRTPYQIISEVVLHVTLTEWLNADVYKRLYGQFKGSSARRSLINCWRSVFRDIGCAGCCILMSPWLNG